MIEVYIKSFDAFLRLEKGLSKASIEAYMSDLKKLNNFLKHAELDKLSIANLALEHLQQFIHYLNELGLSPNSQARIVSSLKAFFRFLMIENIILTDISELLSAPKLHRNIPTVLSYQEVVELFNTIDHSKKEGTRNRAILEVLYACGLRVSELVNLKLSNLYFDVGFVRIIGKGNKERLVPIGESAIKHVRFYLQERNQQENIDPKSRDIVFLNRRGKQLSRNMVFIIIQKLAKESKLTKTVSPHTFRHTFATHLIEGGADLKIVQDLLGHESIITTEIYTHLDMAYLKETIQLFHPRSQPKK
ncbi:MAG: site-specific tyrosine recombinase XerD [Aureispira sp.]|nr:site-specific tyrosine recombinase XerD [Aureispira sp.]